MKLRGKPILKTMEAVLVEFEADCLDRGISRRKLSLLLYRHAKAIRRADRLAQSMLAKS